MTKIQYYNVYVLEKGEIVTFGQRLKEVRQGISKISQGELSRRSGVRRATITDLENGRVTGLTVDTAMKLARGLGVSLEILFRGVDADVEEMMATAVH